MNKTLLYLLIIFAVLSTVNLVTEFQIQDIRNQLSIAEKENVMNSHRISMLEKPQNSSALTFGTVTQTNFFKNKCNIEKFDPIVNIHATNCSFDEISIYLTRHNMTGIDYRFYNGLAIGNENIMEGDALYDAIPAWFTVKYLNGTQELWGDWNGSDIYPYYKIKMAEICQHKCQNGDLP